MTRRYLLDTNVVSAGAPDKRPVPELGEWLHRSSDRLFLSVVTLGELSRGVAKLGRTAPGQRADRLAVWLVAVGRAFAPRILPLGHDIALLSGRLADRAEAIGHAPDPADVLIGATAAHHGLVVLTRNVRHFRPLGLAPIDPFLDLPD